MTGPVLHEIEFRLSYGDCDPAGIVYYATYYQWFERVFSEWTFLNGFPADKTRDLWGASHVSRASGCEYLIPGRLFDPFTCQMTLGHVGNTSFSMRYDVVNRDDGKTYAVGSMWVAVGTALASGPPHRSQRAELPHWAPASGSGCEAHLGKRLHHTDLW